jgi:two-component system OmpR family response regulator
MKTENSIPHILIVDDDTSIRSMLSKFLSDHGLVTSEAGNGRDMAAVLKKSSIDLILLDIMMPGDDGLTLCRRLQAESRIPIILVTAVDSETDRIIGLELGADDYVTKPFSPRELLARIRALLRRSSIGSNTAAPKRSALYSFAGWTIDMNRRNLTSPQKTLVVLTSTEFDLLTVFVENPQKSLNRDQLLDALHGRVAHAFDRTIDVQVSRLRRKIEADPQNPLLIKTIRNEGYFFTPDVTDGTE